MNKLNTIVLAHANCADGLGACYAAWIHFKDSAEYIFMDYGDPLPDIKGKDIFMVDWSVKAEVLDKMLEEAHSITILDHHLSAQKELLEYLERGDIEGVIDMTRSGAVIAWEYFHSKYSMPILLEYIQDRDLWKHELEGTNAIISALYSYDLTLENMHMLISHEDRLLEEGQILLRVIEKAKKESLDKYRIAQFNEHIIMVINDTRSEILNYLLLLSKEANYIVGYTDIKDKTLYSLRSTNDRINVSEIAMSLGGGGHHNAAGCNSPLGKHFWKEELEQ